MGYFYEGETTVCMKEQVIVVGESGSQVDKWSMSVVCLESLRGRFLIERKGRIKHYVQIHCFKYLRCLMGSAAES
jgi:hypothetical protein